ncbi:holdfast anchoring protein HfaA [Brevundimonas sp. R86498]|uniref:holdfast anchoring protein HfaA n=1 Tax=Brevundimonas sp. R86498 TaxID=3093845 RepID=UPI0037C54579
MPLRRTSRLLLTVALASAGLPASAVAQSAGSAGLAQFQNGYGGARQSVATAQTGSTRDANGNRLIVDGLIQAGASTYSRQSGGVSNTYSGGVGNAQGTTIAGSTAIGNNLNVVVQGSNNTVIVNSRQTNTGNVSARTDLTGSLTGFE